MTAGELLVKLGFEVDTLKLNEFIKDLGELNLSSVIAATGFKGMIDGLTDIMKTADGVAASLNKLTGITGVQQGVFQQWENTASQFNVTAGTVSNTIADLQKHIGQLKFGDPFAVKLQSLFPGLQVAGREGDPEGVLHDLLKIMGGMTQEDARDRLVKAGLNAELVQMRGHQDEIALQMKNQDADWQKLQENLSTIKKLTSDWQVLIVGIGAVLAPILTPLVRILNDMVDAFIQMEQIMPEWLKRISSAIVLFGVLYGIIRATLAILTGMAALKWLAPLLGGAATIAAGATPLGIGLAAGGLALAGTVYSLMKPQDNGNGGSSVDNSGDVNMTNNYSISGNNPDDIARQVREYHEAQLRNVQGQARLGYN